MHLLCALGLPVVSQKANFIGLLLTLSTSKQHPAEPAATLYCKCTEAWKRRVLCGTLQLFKQLLRRGSLPAIVMVPSTQTQARPMFIGMPKEPEKYQ